MNLWKSKYISIDTENEYKRQRNTNNKKNELDEGDENERKNVRR